MLNINPEIVCNIIEKARRFFAKEEVAIPSDPMEAKTMSDDWYFQVLEDYKDDLSLIEVKTVINDLEPDQQATLVALLWVGRGDFEIKEWDAAWEEAQRNWTPETAEYLLSKPLLADYLEEALSQFGYGCNPEN